MVVAFVNSATGLTFRVAALAGRDLSTFYGYLSILVHMLSTADVIHQTLDQGTLLPEAWTRSFLEIMAGETVKRFDWRLGTLGPSFSRLDGVPDRAQLLKINGPRMIANTVALIERQRKALNAIVTANGLHAEVKAGKLSGHLNAIVPLLIRKPAFGSVAADNPFPRLWPLVGDRVAGEVHSVWKTTPEWALLNGLLLAEYLHGCALDRAALVEAAWRLMEGTVLGHRGTLVRLPTVITAKGIQDP